MKTFNYPALALCVLSVLASTAYASQDGVYEHQQRIDWKRDAGRELDLPMRCDDIIYRAISFSVPGALGRDFVIRTTGSSCQVSSATFDAAKGETKLVVENDDYCTVTLDQLEQDQIQSVFTFQLFDAC